MLNLNKKATEPQWIKYDEDESVEFLIKPLSIYNFKKMPTGDVELSTEEYANLVCELIVDWKGIVDNDKKLECNDENKKLLLEKAEIMAFIIASASELKIKIVTIVKEEAAKN